MGLKSTEKATGGDLEKKQRDIAKAKETSQRSILAEYRKEGVEPVSTSTGILISPSLFKSIGRWDTVKNQTTMKEAAE